jgi:predicted Zn-dependent protease
LAFQSGSKAPELGLQGRPELLQSAPILIAQGRAGEVAQSLLAWVTAHPRDAAAWQWLAAASAAQGQPLRAIRADAEARVAHLDYAGALERFKAAQTLLRNTKDSIDHFEASIIDTRSRAVQSLLREQSLER